MLLRKAREALIKYSNTAEIPPSFRHFVYALRRLRASVFRAIVPLGWTRLGPPRSVISIYRLLKSGDPSVRGEIVLEGQKVNRTKPGSFTALCRDDQSVHQPYPIFWSHHRDARLVSRTLSLVLPGKKYIAESVYPRAINLDPALQTVWLPAPIHLKGNYTSIVGYGVRNHTIPNFSHWLIDALPRLNVLDRFPPDTVVIVPGVLAPYQKHTLELLGLKDRYRMTPETHLLLDNYYFSSPTAHIMRENPYAIQFLRRNFLPKANSNYRGPKRFVIERKGSRGVANQTEFNQFFHDLGWPIIDTASLSFEDEIQLFSQAEAFAGAIGSGFTNAVWAQPGCAVIQIVPENFMEASTEWICEQNQLRWRFLIFPATPEKKVIVDLPSLRRTLQDLSLI